MEESLQSVVMMSTVWLMKRPSVFQFSSVTHSCPTLCNPHGLQHARLPCPSPTPRVYSNSSCPLSRWCHLVISSSVIPFSCPQSFPASGSFPMISLHQVAKALEFQLQHQSFQWTPRTWSPFGWTGWISLQSKGLSRVFSNIITVQNLGSKE